MIIYKDKLLFIDTAPEPAIEGHALITCTKPVQEVTTQDFSHLLSASSFVSRTLFEVAQAQGSNIIITETQKELQGAILARKEDDGIMLQWKPLQSNPQELDVIAAKIKDQCDYIDQAFSEVKPVVKVIDEKKETKPVNSQDDWEREKNYLLRQLDRLP